MRTKRFADSVKLLLSRPSPKSVVRVQFAVTWRCQLRCEMCRIWEKPKAPELSIDDISKVFSGRDFLKSLRVVDITGGEPFLRADLAEIVRYFAVEFPRASILITTNAYSTELTERLGRGVLDACPADRLEFSISVDGDEQVHDRLRGRAGSFKNALESVRILKGLGARKLTFSTTLTPNNADQLPYIYALARKMGCVFATARFAQNSFYYGQAENVRAWPDDRMERARRGIIELIRARREREGVSLGLLRDAYFMKEAVRFAEMPVRTRPCYSGTHSFFMDPRANVYPCVMLPRLLGNALEDDLESVWFSERAAEIRRFIAERRCACHTECETFSSMQRNIKDVMKIALGVFGT